jgi:hypothetical protein
VRRWQLGLGVGAAVTAITLLNTALRQAARYAAAFDSFVLIVVHTGVVQSGWNGMEPLKAGGWDNARLPDIITRGLAPGARNDAAPEA